MGLVCRNFNGEVFVAKAKHINGCFKAEIGEALAIFFAVKEAISRNFAKVEFESDCQKVINLINSEDVHLSELGMIVADIKLFSRGREFLFIFAPRTCNKVAHKLAHFALSIVDDENWDSLFPDWLLDLIGNDIA